MPLGYRDYGLFGEPTYNRQPPATDWLSPATVASLQHSFLSPTHHSPTMTPSYQTLYQRVTTTQPLPFACYQSSGEQLLLNVPFARPTLIVVLAGCKELAEGAERVSIAAGQAVLVANQRRLTVRNVCAAHAYCALVIDFSEQDFASLAQCPRPEPSEQTQDATAEHPAAFASFTLSDALLTSLQQWLDWAATSPAALWPVRRRELLWLLQQQCAWPLQRFWQSSVVAEQVSGLLNAHLPDSLATEAICKQLAMSESTLRRRLQQEGYSLQTLRDDCALGLGLHLLQTSRSPISDVAAQCGYGSASRFSARFKQRFGSTPRQLRDAQLGR